MSKKEFINYIEERLSVLNKAERDDIINEYIQHIDNKLAEGMSEKEAVATLGDVEDMVREILSAYNVDPDYNKENEKEINNVVKGVFGKFVNNIKSIYNDIVGKRTEKTNQPENIIRKIIVLAIKIMILMFILPCIFTLIFSVIVFGGMLICSLMGYPLIGLTISCLGFNIVGISIVLIILKLTFFNKAEVK